METEEVVLRRPTGSWTLRTILLCTVLSSAVNEDHCLRLVPTVVACAAGGPEQIFLVGRLSCHVTRDWVDTQEAEGSSFLISRCGVRPSRVQLSDC